ncbi:hypothetical protein THASP1DRAFT_11048, partial [Thamnocephalis sphaerospora]
EKKLEAYLQNEATQFQRDQEVERVLACFKLDPFTMLELPYECTEKDIKMAYRRKSLLIHPDKAKHPRAQEAFDLLKKAETDMNDEKRRPWLLQLVGEARHNVYTARNVKPGTDPSLEATQAFKDEVRAQLKAILIEEELRRRRLLKREMELEGEAARKVEEVGQQRKRKKEQDKAWEDTRDSRVGNWRDFLAGGKSKK